jgi:hypothetical protein
MLIGLLLLVAVPTQAGPVRFGDVINVMGDLQSGGQQQLLRLRAAPQDPATTTQNPSTSSTGAVTPAIAGGPLTASISTTSATQAAPGDLTSGIEVTAQQPQSNVQVFTQDSVDGTICDCGEIAAAGGIPLWPFLALIPLVCVTGVCSHHNNTCPECITTPSPSPSVEITPFCVSGGCAPTPSPSVGITPFCVSCFSPTPTPTVPEPTSILLFGSGIVTLTAAARRRHRKNRAAKDDESEKEGE